MDAGFTIFSPVIFVWECVAAIVEHLNQVLVAVRRERECMNEEELVSRVRRERELVGEEELMSGKLETEKLQ